MLARLVVLPQLIDPILCFLPKRILTVPPRLGSQIPVERLDRPLKAVADLFCLPIGVSLEHLGSRSQEPS